jgi:hypothetical protein
VSNVGGGVWARAVLLAATRKRTENITSELRIEEASQGRRLGL